MEWGTKGKTTKIGRAKSRNSKKIEENLIEASSNKE